MNKEGLLHRTRRAVIFQVLKQRLPMNETLSLLGIKEETLRHFLSKEGFLDADQVDGPYKEDLKALRSITGIELENGKHTVGAARRIENLITRVNELMETSVKYNQLMGVHARLKNTLESERSSNRQLKVINSALRKALGKAKADEVVEHALQGDEKAQYLPTPEVIEAECAKIREANGKRGPFCEGEIAERPDKIYKLKFKGDRRLP